ncbi:CPXV054 protein, partial [Monkeypox virus]
RYRHTIESVYF